MGKKAVFIACDRLESYTGYFRERYKELFGDVSQIPPPKSNPQVSEDTMIHAHEINSATQILVDMRSYASYEFGHIEGSINYPYDQLSRYLQEDYLPLPRESMIVFICPYGEESLLMAHLARELGYQATSLVDGYQGYNQSIIS